MLIIIALFDLIVLHLKYSSSQRNTWAGQDPVHGSNLWSLDSPSLVSIRSASFWRGTGQRLLITDNSKIPADLEQQQHPSTPYDFKFDDELLKGGDKFCPKQSHHLKYWFWSNTFELSLFSLRFHEGCSNNQNSIKATMILFGEAGHTNPLCGASEYCNQEIRATPVRRLEICQKIYTTGFSGQKFYPLKVRKLRLFLLKEKQRICIYIS